jgi:hypothetical protein
MRAYKELIANVERGHRGCVVLISIADGVRVLLYVKEIEVCISCTIGSSDPVAWLMSFV